MDVGARAELDALRHRAYGPGAGLTDDPEALQRLAVLEEILRLERSPDVVAAVSASVPAARPAPSEERSVETPSRDPSGDRTPRRRRPRIGLLIGAVSFTLAVVLIGAVLARGPAADPTAEPTRVASGSVSPDSSTYAFQPAAGSVELLRVPIDGSFGSFQDLPSDEERVEENLGELRWGELLGDYYGFDLWIASREVGGVNELCLVVLGDVFSAYDCAQQSVWAVGVVFVPVPYLSVAAEERPAGLDPDDSLGFWWPPDDSIHVLSTRSTLDSSSG